MDNPYLYLPLDMREELCVGLLQELGVTDIRHNPKKHELTHPCQVSDYHTDQENNPTASINYEKLVFKCLGCQASGSIMWFVAVSRGTNSKDARKWIEKKSGGGPEKDLSFLLRYIDAMYSQERARPEPIPAYSRRAIEKWEVESHPYLESRGIDESACSAFALGYNSEADAIIIPHFWGEQLVGWQSRQLNGRMPKYLNTPGFPKKETLFHYTATPEGIGYLEGTFDGLVMEAPMSVVRHPTIFSDGRHLESTATFGANVSKRQISLLEKFDRVVLWFDNDPARWKATRRVGNALRGHDLWVVDSPFFGDPGEYADELAQQIVDNCLIPYSVWKEPKYLCCQYCEEAMESEKGSNHKC